MNYQTYYKGIKDQLAKYSDVVYYEPLSEKEIQAIEKQIGTTIKSLFREYLLTFGFTQDIFEKVTALKDSWLDDVEFIKNSYPDYLPVFCDIDEDDTLYLINNIDPEDDYVYQVIVEDDEPSNKKVKIQTFQSLIEEGISELAKDPEDRTLNTEKANVVEFKFHGNSFSSFIESFKNKGLKQTTNWRAKYFPDNIFGDEVADFELFDVTITIERDADHKLHEFELEEPVYTKKENSMIAKIIVLLNAEGIEYETMEYKGI
jgi:hypothetical protein